MSEDTLYHVIRWNVRNRKTPKHGRKRLFNAAIHALRERVERTFAWEDKCQADVVARRVPSASAL